MTKPLKTDAFEKLKAMSLLALSASEILFKFEGE